MCISAGFSRKLGNLDFLGIFDSVAVITPPDNQTGADRAKSGFGYPDFEFSIAGF
jgi:hypothetical protein